MCRCSVNMYVCAVVAAAFFTSLCCTTRANPGKPTNLPQLVILLCFAQLVLQQTVIMSWSMALCIVCLTSCSLPAAALTVTHLTLLEKVLALHGVQRTWLSVIPLGWVCVLAWTWGYKNLAPLVCRGFWTSSRSTCAAIKCSMQELENSRCDMLPMKEVILSRWWFELMLSACCAHSLATCIIIILPFRCLEEKQILTCSVLSYQLL